MSLTRSDRVPVPEESNDLDVEILISIDKHVFDCTQFLLLDSKKGFASGTLEVNIWLHRPFQSKV